jgi:PiT family inorganic phosphate transporter
VEIYGIAFIVFLALVFDFINGFHDAANSIATIVSTRVLQPKHAVIWAACFNFIAFIFFETRVANTIGQGLVDPHILTPLVIFAALLGAIIWNLVTWYLALPSSSSHALVGGLVGAALVKAGTGSLILVGLAKVVASIVLSPLLGLVLAALISLFTARLCRNQTPRYVDKWFRRLQFVSAGLYSLGHGGNDAQKTMGIIAVLLFSSGYLGTEFHVPFWIVILCQTAMGLGTLMGGWKIVKTMGLKITKLKPIGGFSAESAGALTLFFATSLGIPVSTTHTITGAILGAGSVYSPHTVRWGIAGRIIWAWVLTIPAAAFISGATLFIFGQVIR